MGTLFNWNTRDGASRRCDARCHTAKNLKCTCICAGRYHGCATKPGGLETARQHMKANIAAWRTQEERDAAEQKRDQVQPLDLQLSLFDGR